MFRIEISDRTEAEYSHAYWYYEDKSAGLGELFEQEADNTLTAIKSNPLVFQRKYKHFREALLRKFPYFIVYEIVATKIVVHSFFHTSRNPKMKYKPGPDTPTVNESQAIYRTKKGQSKAKK